MFAIADMNFYSTGNLFFRSWCLIKDIIRTGSILRPAVKRCKGISDSLSTLDLMGRVCIRRSSIRVFYICAMSMVTWYGENMPAGGVDFSSLRFFGRFLQEWEETLSRDFNHPSIVTWCPLNETWGTWEDAET